MLLLELRAKLCVRYFRQDKNTIDFYLVLVFCLNFRFSPFFKYSKNVIFVIVVIDEKNTVHNCTKTHLLAVAE